MTSPLAWLAGLGAGAESLGSDINQRDILRRAKERQDAQDAITRLLTLQKIGGVELPSGANPSVMQQGMQQQNDAVSGLIPGGTPSAIPNEATGMPDESLPNAFGRVTTATIPGLNGQPSTVMIDPSKTPEALQERRASLQQAAIDRREQMKEAAAMARLREGETAKTLSGTKAAKSDFATLKAMNPSHPLVQGDFDPDNAANYAKAIDFERQKQLQASAYHPPSSEWVETPSVGPNGRVVIMNKVTGERKEAEIGAPKPASGSSSSQGALTSLPDLLRTHDAMSTDENDPNFKVTRAAQATEGGNYGMSHAFDSGTSPAIGSLASALGGSVLGGASDRQTNYLKNARSWGEDASNAWKGRTNEERVKRDITTGKLDASTTDNAAVRRSTQERRENVIAMTAIANPTQLAALPAADQQRIQGYINRLPPDKAAVAKQAAQVAPAPQSSAAPKGKTAIVNGRSFVIPE